MSKELTVTLLIGYFLLLILVAYLTSRTSNNNVFFRGERKSPWFLVAFGMIGASLSGVTFISIPGWVGDASNQFSYMQAVFGYFVGYLIVAYVLIPLYYRLNVTSIYEYLEGRFGFWSYKTGAAFFLAARILGASVRLLLVANVLQQIVFTDEFAVPFPVTVIISVALIWLYTNRGGIKTIVWTDTLQTLFMLASVILTVWLISDAMNLSEEGGTWQAISNSGFSKVFFWDDLMGSNHFLKHFFGGIFITVGMTGLDQDMMQKNLTCKTVGDARKNILTMASILVVVNFIFLSLGALLYMYVGRLHLIPQKPDLLFSAVAFEGGLGKPVAILFLLGLIAAAYSSADSALTSLTTSFSIDFLDLKKKKSDERKKEQIRKLVHVMMSVVIILVVLLLKYATDESAIGLLMKLASFTYGPLIGMFFFGILTKSKLNDKLVPLGCFLSILITFLVWSNSAGGLFVEKGMPGLLGEYKFGFELIILNALTAFLLLFFFSFFSKGNKSSNA